MKVPSASTKAPEPMPPAGRTPGTRPPPRSSGQRQPVTELHFRTWVITRPEASTRLIPQTASAGRLASGRPPPPPRRTGMPPAGRPADGMTGAMSWSVTAAFPEGGSAGSPTCS